MEGGPGSVLKNERLSTPGVMHTGSFSP